MSGVNKYSSIQKRKCNFSCIYWSTMVILEEHLQKELLFVHQIRQIIAYKAALFQSDTAKALPVFILPLRMLLLFCYFSFIPL